MDLHNIEYKDWFINQGRIPDESSSEYKAFFNFHKELCMNGCMMDGQYINPFLYWHLNIWHTEVDTIDEYGRINQKYANPLLRDNEWLVTNEIDRAHKEKMYYPQEVDDIFLNEDTNIFDIESAKRQKNRLQQVERTGTPVILYMDDNGGIGHEFTDKLPITNFPLKNSDNKDAPVVIYEFPVESPAYGLYVAGVDPYRQGQSAYSSSLGAVYVYKRMHDITGEKYQDMFVASYCARPDNKDHWNEQARFLIKYYNARTLCENDDISFIEYMKSKGDAHYLERQPDWLKEIVPNTTVKRDYGIHRSSQKIIDYLHTCLKHYMEEAIYVEKDDNGVVIKETLGVNKIFDPVLLEEIIQYNDQGNFDRIIAAELAIAQAMKMDPIMGKVGGSGDARVKAMFSKKQGNILFTDSRAGMFGKSPNRYKRNKLFT